MKDFQITVFWFRRDLRLADNAALYHALKENKQVLPVFIFDTDILDLLEDKKDARVEFILLQLNKLQKSLTELGSSLKILKGKPLQVFKALTLEFDIKKVYANHDYEPSAIKRDNEVANFLNSNGIDFLTFKDQVIFEKNEVLKDDGTPYTIFTPYMRRWKSQWKPFYTKAYPTEKYFQNFFKTNPFNIPNLGDIGFQASGIDFPDIQLKTTIIQRYKEQRDFPAENGTSRLSVHLRFGTISIRTLVAQAQIYSETWLNELIWREFYMMILYHFPHVVHTAFKPSYDNIPWINNETHFELWCNGKTGYPIVDAGMNELNATGFMHNRVRMITASFLTKHLLIDWRWGEAYFAKKLLDFELSSNNGGWQWSASSGCDAAPYFRVFNPYEQTKKFDPQLKYIRKWIKNYDELHYIKPIVDHKYARERVISTYKNALNRTA